MINITFLNFEESSFITGYVKMKTPIITNWYPRLKIMNVTLSKDDDEYTLTGIMTFNDAVSEVTTTGQTAIQAIDAFLNEIDPELNTIPPMSAAVMQQRI